MSVKQYSEVDASDYLGFQYDEFLNEVMAIAMSTPALYYKIRSDTLKALKQVVITQVYESYYNLLTLGEVNGKIR